MYYNKSDRATNARVGRTKVAVDSVFVPDVVELVEEIVPVELVGDIVPEVVTAPVVMEVPEVT